MLAMKAQFDGTKVILPTIPAIHKCPVVVVFEEESVDREDDAWVKAQESALSRVWLNDEDAVYDDL